jgi:Protein of unknown function (DUF3225)
MEINRPEVVASVAAAFEAYEVALVANDVDAMAQWFWDSELTVRYGVNECLVGAEAIAAWRRTAAPLPEGRQLRNTVIVTFGLDSATVSTEFTYPDRPTVGRQSQTWIRFPQGWRVVAAHVSVMLQPGSASHGRSSSADPASRR